MELFNVNEWRTPLGVGLLFDLRGQFLNLLKTVWDNADGRFDNMDQRLKCVPVSARLQHLDKKPAGESCCYVVLGKLQFRKLTPQVDDTGANLVTTLLCSGSVSFVCENPDADVAALMADYVVLALTGLNVNIEETMCLRHFSPVEISEITNVGSEGSPVFRSIAVFAFESQVSLRGRRESLVLRRVDYEQSSSVAPHP